MKKIFLLITVIIALLAVSACEQNPDVDKSPANTSSVTAEDENYTVLSDGSRLYKKSGISNESKVQFKDEDGNVLLDSSDILTVSAKWSELCDYYLELEFTQEGSESFASATRENIGKNINVVLGEQVLSSSMVNAEITGGKAIISSNISYDELISLFNKIVG